jgi:hypothetical protein
MHACLIHDHVRALLYLFIYLMLIFMGIGHGLVHASLFKQRPIAVMFTSSIRQYYFFPFAVSRMVLVCWQIALYSYVSSHLAL